MLDQIQNKRRYLLELFVAWVLLSFISAAALVSLNGCAVPGGGEPKSFTEMNPKEKSLFLMKTYNKQYDDYIQLYEKGDWTEAEEEILRKKHAALKELYPLIDIYAAYAEEGVIPPVETEKAALLALDKLLGV